MPRQSCAQANVLTGQDGLLVARPPGTLVCLKDYSDFPAGTAITVPVNCDFRIGDPVVFAEKSTANPDSALALETVYYIVARPTPDTVRVSATVGGSPITLNGDGGTGTANTANPAAYIEMSYPLSQALCEVASVTLSISRGEIDRTSIPCRPPVGPDGPKFARFRQYQAGFADGSGTVTIRLTEELQSFNNRLIQSVLFNNQAGTTLKAYFNAMAGSDGVEPDDAESLYWELPIVLLGFDTNLSQEDSPTELSINFRVTGEPRNTFATNDSSSVFENDVFEDDVFE
jgi:hypothetical protein